MNGYLLKDRQLVCHVVPTNKLHDGMFKLSKPKDMIESENVIMTLPNADMETECEQSEDFVLTEKKIKRIKVSQRNKQKRLKELGIDFDLTILNKVE